MSSSNLLTKLFKCVSTFLIIFLLNIVNIYSDDEITGVTSIDNTVQDKSNMEDRYQEINNELKNNVKNLENTISNKEAIIEELKDKVNTFTSFGVENNIINTKSILFSISGLLILALLLIIIVLLKTISWRRDAIDKVVENGAILQFPHETNEIIKNSQSNIQDIIEQLIGYVSQRTEEINDKNSTSLEKINNINAQLEIFNKKISENEQDLARYKEGYDYSIKKNYINLLIKLSAISEVKNNTNSDNTLTAVNELIDDYLDGENIKKYSLHVGSGIQGQKEARTITEDTNDSAKAGLVIENIEQGYIIRMPEGEKVVKPALVKIYKYQNKGDN